MLQLKHSANDMVFILVTSAVAASLVTAQLTTSNNPITVLQNQPSFSTFAKLLTDTGVAAEIASRSSLTLLLPENSVLDALVNRSGNSLPRPLVGDVLRYHCLLQYLDIPQIKSMTNQRGMLVTSLYQTTGRAAGQNGFVNISVGTDGAIHAGLPFADKFNATLLKNITQFPYNISYIQIDNVLIPSDLGRPQAAAASILNFTTSLQRAGRFSTFLSLMQTTGLTALLASLPSYSVFVPTDDAFNGLPSGTLQALSPSQASSLMAYHTLPAYTSLDSLQRQNSMVRTLATGSDNQKFLLQVSPTNGGVSLSTGVDIAQVVSNVYDQPPAAAYSINRVLLPKEIFAAASTNDSVSSPVGAPAPAPAALSPAAAATPLVNVVPPFSSPPPSEQQAGSAPAPVLATPAGPVVDVRNLPPAAGPGASTENSGGVVSMSLASTIALILASLFS